MAEAAEAAVTAATILKQAPDLAAKPLTGVVPPCGDDGA